MKSRTSLLQLSRNWQCRVPKSPIQLAGFGVRHFTPTMDNKGKIQPAKRVAGRKQDVWYVVNSIALSAFHNGYLWALIWRGSFARGNKKGGRYLQSSCLVKYWV